MNIVTKVALGGIALLAVKTGRTAYKFAKKSTVIYVDTVVDLFNNRQPPKEEEAAVSQKTDTDAAVDADFTPIKE